MKFISRLALCACVALQALTASAQAPYPNKTIKLVVPLPPGGLVDGLARMLQPKLAQLMGQTIVIENVTGAAGRIGTAQVVRSVPDGYTMLMMYDTLPTDPILYKKSLPYDPLKDLRPVSLITLAPQVAVSSINIPAHNIAELVSYAKLKSSKLNYGSAGNGSSSHLAAALFSRTTGAPMTHIPYNGGAPLMTALVGGHVNAVLANYSEVAQQVAAGRAAG